MCGALNSFFPFHDFMLLFCVKPLDKLFVLNICDNKLMCPF